MDEKGGGCLIPNKAHNVKDEMQMIRRDAARRRKHGKHVRRANHHLDVVAHHENVRHALEALLLDGGLGAAAGVAAGEGAAVGEEEGPEGEAQGDESLADEADDDLGCVSGDGGE